VCVQVKEDRLTKGKINMERVIGVLAIIVGSATFTYCIIRNIEWFFVFVLKLFVPAVLIIGGLLIVFVDPEITGSFAGGGLLIGIGVMWLIFAYFLEL
jgi:hypothetical protein